METLNGTFYGDIKISIVYEGTTCRFSRKYTCYDPDVYQMTYMKSQKLYISTEHKMDSLMVINDIDFLLLVVFG